MSISLEEWPKIQENYKKVKEKVFSVLGDSYLNSNHYGQTILHNELITINTRPERIIKIRKKYLEIIQNIQDYFNENNVELKNEYFSHDPMSGMKKFLDVSININKGFKHLKPTIDQFIGLYKKIANLSSKYKSIKNIQLHTYWSWDHRVYCLFKEKIKCSTEDCDLDKILSSYNNMNKRVNGLLRNCKYKKRNCIIPKGNFKYYLLGQEINLDTPVDQIIKIINNAQLFESNVKCVLKELNIIEEYEIEYNDKATVWFSCMGSSFYIGATYDEIKKSFIESDTWHHFKKRNK